MFCCGRVAMNDGGKDTGGMAGEGWFRTSRDGATLVFAVGGRWTLATAAGLDEKLGQVTTAGGRQGGVDLWAGDAPETRAGPPFVPGHRAISIDEVPLARDDRAP